MGRNINTTLLVNSLLRTVALGGVTITAIIAPGALSMLDKPLQKYLRSLDQKQQKQELLRLIRYSRRQKLITDTYQHGLKLTDKAAKRLETIDLDNLTIPQPDTWDRLWRVIFYDVPESKKTGRDALSSKLKSLGCYQLQRSVWVHPFPCQEEILTVGAAYGVNSYITIIEATSIQNPQRLKQIFGDLI